MFDASGAFRYHLWRAWDPDRPHAVFVMLNPSTADAQRADLTVRSCLRLAGAWGCGSLETVNLFALRSTDPRRLRSADDPFGPENDHAIVEAVGRADLCIAAWGSHGELHGRADSVRALLRPLTVPIACLGLTRRLQPRHPLYLPTNVQTVPFDC